MTTDMRTADAALAERMEAFPEMIARCKDMGRPMLLQGYLRNGYRLCRRGVYHARLIGCDWDPPATYPLTGAWNTSASVLRKVCWPDPETLCVRDSAGASTGERYDNCPAIHALEAAALSIDRAGGHDELVWMEAGVSMPGTPAARWLHLGPDDPYPCLRCLSRAAWLGVKALAWLNVDGGSAEIRWCDVEAHARYLISRTASEGANR